MKIINEKGKLFGLINLVDLLTILLLVLMVGGGAWKLLGSTIQETAAPTVKMVSVMRVRGAMPSLYDALDDSDKRIVSGNSYTGATITEWHKEPYLVQVPKDDGDIVTSQDPYKIDIVVTVESTVNEGTSSPKIGSQEVRAGRTFILKTQTFEVIANIESVVFE